MVYFLQDWIVNPMLNLLKRTLTYLGFEPWIFGVAVSIPNHYTIEVDALVQKIQLDEDGKFRYYVMFATKDMLTYT
jgi:hypothetical protein